jgi:hypothetical protein
MGRNASDITSSDEHGRQRYEIEVRAPGGVG